MSAPCGMCTHWGITDVESAVTVKMDLWEADKHGNVQLCLECAFNPDRHYDDKMAEVLGREARSRTG